MCASGERGVWRQQRPSLETRENVGALAAGSLPVSHTGFPRWPHLPLPSALMVSLGKCVQLPDVPGSRGDPAPRLPGELAQVSPGSGLDRSSYPWSPGPGPSFCSAPSWSVLPTTQAHRSQQGAAWLLQLPGQGGESWGGGPGP